MGAAWTVTRRLKAGAIRLRLAAQRPEPNATVRGVAAAGGSDSRLLPSRFDSGRPSPFYQAIPRPAHQRRHVAGYGQGGL